MKLNLLPTHVSKEAQNKVAVVVSVLVALVGVAAAVYMVIVPAAREKELDGQILTERDTYNKLVAKSAQAQAVINEAQMVIRNINLAGKMLEHSDEYPNLYDDVKGYIPSFFRVHTMRAQPSGAGSTVVTMTGVIKTYQQYADLMMALLKNPEVASVARTGFQNIDPSVPALTPGDQRGKPIRPGEAPIPDDPLARLDYLIAQGRVTGYTGTGGFGTTDTGARRAMPNWSEITVVMVLRRDLQTPNPRATLSQQGSAPGGPPGPGNAAPAPSPTRSMPGRTGPARGDDE